MASNPHDMTPTRRPSRKRLAAGLCAAGVIAVAFGGNLLPAGAEETAVSAAQEPAPPKPAASDPPAPPAAHADTATTSTTPPPAPAPTTTTPTTPAPTTTATTPTGTTTAPVPTGATTATTPAPETRAPAAPTTDTSPAPAPVQTTQQPAPAAPSAPIMTSPLPFGGFAGPPGTPPTARCSRSTSVDAQHRGASFSSDGSAPAEPVAACDRPPGHAENTISPERLAGQVQDEAAPAPRRNAAGEPTVADPLVSLALPGAVPVGVPDFFIEKFRIPPFLLPIFQAAGTEYGVRWEVLAAINEIETDYGRNLNVSSAGALGWMQFLPQTWALYGTDANGDGRRDPFNPVDAIFASARYLKAAGADQDLRRAIFAYNHADWYVESVLMRARLIGGLPSDLVGSLSGLTQGRFPVYAKARYTDDIAQREAAARAAVRSNAPPAPAVGGARRGIDIFAKARAPVIAVQDATVTAVGESARLGRYVKLRDAYGNTYTYARLGRVVERVPVPKAKTQSRASIASELSLPQADPAPTRAASAGAHAAPRATAAAAPAVAPADAVSKQRLFAHPTRSGVLDHGGARQIFESGAGLRPDQSLRSYVAGPYGLGKADVVLKSLVKGRRVIAGTILGHIATRSPRVAPRLHFEIRPAGRGAPRIDPKPILDGWKLLESTAIYRAQGKNPLLGAAPSIGQIMLMSKEALAQRVLANPRIEIYSCGRRDIHAGTVDRRILATLEFLAASGLKPTVSSLTCGHGYYTAGGNVSEHASGNAVDIAKINDIPILGHQGEGSITDLAIRRLLTLQGTGKPHQIISLMTYQGADNTLALQDHADHIHIGFQPQYKPGTPDAHQLDAVLKPTQWVKLIDRLGHIANPAINPKPSAYAIRVPVPRASVQHRGE
jgi:murein DD-endopeptidase MepM/ murein hydrolase activator NlpD